MKQSASKSRMLLLELLLCVFIFSFCVIICAGIFFHGSNIATQSRDLTYSVQVAQSAAEAFKSTGSTDEFLWLMGGIKQDGALIVFYDANFNVTDGEWVHALHVVVRERDGFSTADISIGNYNLTVSKLNSEVTP